MGDTQFYVIRDNVPLPEETCGRKMGENSLAKKVMSMKPGQSIDVPCERKHVYGRVRAAWRRGYVITARPIEGGTRIWLMKIGDPPVTKPRKAKEARS